MGTAGTMTEERRSWDENTRNTPGLAAAGSAYSLRRDPICFHISVVDDPLSYPPHRLKEGRHS